jgi:thiazole/oxazole-forming peptide maturase SagD family component
MTKLVERIEKGEERTPLPLPVQRAYSLSELIPRRPGGLVYQLTPEMGAPLARAFEGAVGLMDKAYGGLSVASPSHLLTPRWSRVFARLVHHGLAQALLWSHPLTKGVPLYYFDISTPFHAHKTDGARPELPRFSRGFSDDYDEALSKVVGECLERAPLLYFRMQELVRGSARALRAAGTPFVEPKDLAVFAESQWERRPELKWDDDSIFRWRECTSLTTSRKALLPAQLLHWNYPVGWGDVPEPMIREQSSHGAGGFFSLEGAVLSGALECIQRDGFFLHWLRRVVPRRIDPKTIERPRTLALIEKARAAGLSCVFLDITSELAIPTCLALLLRDDDELPHMSMGGATRLDGASAVHDALLEAASVHHVLARGKERVRLSESYEPFTDPTFYTHKRLAFWANPEHHGHLELFLRGDETSVRELSRGIDVAKHGKDARSALAFVRDVLTRHRMDAWYFEADHAALRELGYASVRVVIPGLVPLYYEERNAPLGVRRLYESKVVERAPEGPLTPWPHPFP